MNCAGILFEEPDVPNPCNCEGTFPPRQGEGVVKPGLEVDSAFAADVSTLTEDSNIVNSYLNDSLTDVIPDEEQRCDKASSEAATVKGGNIRSKWLSSVLQRRKAKQERYKQLKALCNSSSTTPKTLGTVDESFSVSSEDGDEDLPHEDNNGLSSNQEESPKRSTSGSTRRKALTLNLDEYDDDEFGDLVKHLKERTDVTKLEIYRNNPGKDGSGVGTRSISDLGTFFSEVGGLTQLQEVVLWNFNPDCSWLLTCFLKERPTIRSFRLHHARGSMSQDLLKALVQVPTLTDIVLEMQHDFPLDILFSSSSLRTLKINGLYNIGRKNFARAMRILGRNNRSLQMLDLKPNISSTSIRDLSEAVEQNKTMEKLYFSSRDDDVGASGEALVDLAKGLTKNQSLKEVVNRNYQSVQVSNEHRMFASAFLESNTTLDRFQFYNERACVDSSTSDDSTSCNRGSIATDVPEINSEAILSWLASCGALCER